MGTARNKDDFLNATTGLFKDNTTGDISPADLQDLVESLHPSFGSLYFSTPSATTISVATTYYKAAGTTTSVNLHRFTMPSDNRLTYTGTPDIHVHIACSISITAGAASQEVAFRMAKNGTTLAHSEISLVHGTGADVGSTALHSDVSLSTNDYLELWVTNSTSTASVTVQSGYLFAMGMFI